MNPSTMIVVLTTAVTLSAILFIAADVLRDYPLH
jgi:hypothetical protein